MSNEKNEMTEETEYGEIEIDLYNANKTLRFTGKAIACEDDQFIAGREQNRWDLVELYETQSKKYILVSEYQTRWQGEQCTIDYQIFNSKQELIDYAIEQDDHLINACLKQADFPIVITID